MLVTIGCSKNVVKESEPQNQTLVGHIVIKDNEVYFDEVEIIQREDKERIAELGLDESDYPSGYCILNQEKEEVIFKLTDKTEYIFTDVYGYFVDDEQSNKLYTTTKRDEFLKHLGDLNNIPLTEQTIPYFIEIQNGNVISITEDIIYTILIHFIHY